MTYVISDIHGEYEKYIAMLDKIKLKDSDTLYVLGDVVDRGDKPIDILQDMMSRSNVFPIVGNHELMALDLLQKLSVEITENNYDTHIDEELMEDLLQWQFNGGETTITQYHALLPEEREYILEYLEEFVPYELVKVGNRKFLLVHSGLGNYSPDKELDEYTLQELTYIRPDYDQKYIDEDDFFIISGHTPTLVITGKAEIYKSNNNICIDCGATFEGGRLACICLDTMEEFYI
ncbi:MAG: metallophosphoesterase [Clostridia bacterium]|nr:metallophosphoesterase [Clostridia bacterium]